MGVWFLTWWSQLNSVFPTAPSFGQADGRATVGREDGVPSPPAAAHGAGEEWGREAAGKAWNSYSLLVHPLVGQLSFTPAGRKCQRCVTSFQTGNRASKTKLCLPTILVTKPNLWSFCIRNEECEIQSHCCNLIWCVSSVGSATKYHFSNTVICKNFQH